jgi:hypothetical protein
LSLYFPSRKDPPVSIAHMIALQNRPILPPAKVDISLLLKPQDEEEAPGNPTPLYPPRMGFSIPPPVPAAPILTTGPPAVAPPLIKSAPGLPAKRLQPAHTAESPAKAVQVVARGGCAHHRTAGQWDEVGGYQQTFARSQCDQLSSSLSELSGTSQRVG